MRAAPSSTIGIHKLDERDFGVFWRWVIGRELDTLGTPESLARVEDARVTTQWIVSAVRFGQERGMLRDRDFARDTAAAFHEFRRTGIAVPVGDQDLPYESLSGERKADLLGLVQHAIEMTGHLAGRST